MPLSGALTSTIQLLALRKAIDGAVKNKSAIADPVMMAILAADRGIGPLIGRLTDRISTLDLGGAKASANAEGAAAVAATAITPANTDFTPARYEFARDLKDSERVFLLNLGTGEIPASILDAMVAESMDVWANTTISNILALSTAASYSMGTSGAALAWSAFYNGYLDMVNRGAGADLMAAIRVKGVKDLASDSLSLGGAVAMATQVQQFLTAGGTGYIGTFFGGCRLYMLDDVPTAAADDVGMMWSARGIGTRHQIVPLPEECDGILQAGAEMGWITVEAKRAATSGNTRLETAFWQQAKQVDAKGVAKILYKTA